MNEQIRIRFTSNGVPLPTALVDGGLVLNGESSAAPRRIRLEFDGATPATRTRMEFVRQRHGWPPRTFPLAVTGAADGFVVAGNDRQSLPPGLYELRLTIGDLQFPKGGRLNVELDEDATVEVALEASDDPRQVRLTRPLDQLPAGLQRVLAAPRSTVDGMPALAWLDSLRPRASRKACLLNVLAKLASNSAPLLDTVETIFFADVDRIYTEVTPACAALVERLAADPRRPFFAEGTPKAAVHLRILERAGVSRDRYRLRSYRQEGRNCLQVVVAAPRDGERGRHFAEFDIDLGNPLQDVAGIFVHLGELLDPDRTDHFALRERLLRDTAARDFICYDVVEPHVDVRVLGV